QPTLASAPDVSPQPDRDEASGAPAVPQKSPAVTLIHGRADDELTGVAPSERPSYDVQGAKTIALIHPAAPHSNTLLPQAILAGGNRHAGSVLSVGPDSLVIHKVGRAGEEQKLHVTITRKTRIIESRRNPAASDVQDAFIDERISLAEIQKGDYVVIDASRERTKFVAASISVTLRHETGVIRPDPSGPTPPTIDAIPVAARVEQRKHSPVPTASTKSTAQPPAPDDGEDPRAVIEWLLYPASVRTR